ncbi:MAG: thioredoxin family protein [Burkholderiales bacterium]|nr:thioredoxin family protein [Burkholderiales bacterium]
MNPPAPSTEPLLVACLCAQWCRTCDAYRDTLAATRDAIRLGHPDRATRFVWVDIEDESELVGDLDIEDFPTLLLARGDEVLFFGPILPHAQTLDRLVRGALDSALPPLTAAALAPDVHALPARLRAHEEI